ncbi:MAG: hypothetical protein RL410_1240 [Actinomycetota bacterium]|jgi:signal peptidase I
MRRAFNGVTFTRAAATHLIRVSVCAAVLYVSALIVLHLTGLSFVTVISNSMSPSIHRGDLVVIVNKHPQSNDVALFRHGDQLVVHRLVRLNSENQWITRGDANAVDDPWRVAASDVKGAVKYVIRGFGFPLMAWQSAIAAFTRTSHNSALARSTYWAQSAMSWVKYANMVYISTKTPNYVSMIFNSDRKIWSSQSLPGQVHFHMFGKLSAVDSQAGGFHVVLNSCVTTSDAINCGLVVTFNNQTKKIQLRSFSSGSFSSEWSASPFTFSLMQDHHYSIYRGANSLQVLVDSEPLMTINDLSGLAQSKNIALPNGSMCGVWLAATNRMTDARINFW